MKVRTRGRLVARLGAASLLALTFAVGAGATSASAAPPDAQTQQVVKNAIAKLMPHLQAIMAAAASGHPMSASDEQSLLADYNAVYAELDGAAQQLLNEKLGPLAPMVPKIAALGEPAGCMSVRELGTDQVTGRYMTVEGKKFVARIHVAHDLCAPANFELVSWTKINGKAWPAPQAQFDSDMQTIQAAGDYTLQANIQANAAGDPCASQADLSRAGSLEGGQVTLPGIIGYLQTDTPAAAACTTVAGATQTHDPGVASSVSAASGTLPNTGSGPLPLAITGLMFIVLGWFALCFASLEGAVTRRQRVVR
jgi:hypothetical protein